MKQPQKNTGKATSAATPAKARGRKRRWVPFAIKLSLALSVVLTLWVIYLDAVVRDKFEGRKWSLPAQVYARPLDMYEGKGINPALLEYELELLSYKKVNAPTANGSYSLRGDEFVIRTRGFDFPEAPQPAVGLQFQVRAGMISNLAVNGKADPAALVKLEPYLIGGIYPAQKEDRLLVRLDQVPTQLIAMLLATEDKGFYEHGGIAPLSIARALIANLSAGRTVQGGSTLTQQLVKNFYLTDERSLQRKLTEAVMALLLEIHYEKDQILETYLNEIYLGQAGQREIHGFGMAAQFYFGQSLQSLELHQSALLVALVKGANWYNPRRNPERALARRNLVLDLLAEAGTVPAQAIAKAKARPLDVTPLPGLSTNRFPAFFELMQRQLASEYRSQDLQTEGLRIFTTLDPQVQQAAELSLASALNDAEKTAKKFGNPTQIEGAVVVTMAESGDVVAVVGGRDPRFDGFNRALDAVRPVGSLIKPAIYLAALEQPAKYALATELDDTAFSLTFENGDTWQPQNYDKTTRGKVLLQDALAHSLNLASARLGLALGIPQVTKRLHALGLERDISPYPSMLLGATNHTPMDMARLYQSFAAGGFRVPMHAVRSVSTHQGKTLSRYPYEVRQVSDAASVYLLNHALMEVMTTGTGRSAKRWLPPGLQVAGKTGTTNEGRDSWFAGFSGDYLGVVWVGKDDNSATGLTGSTGALPVWARMMAKLPQRPYEAMEPDGLKQVQVGRRQANGSLDCDVPLSLPAVEPIPPGLPVCEKVSEAGWWQKLFN